MLEKEAYLKNVLSLAYLGDAVFSLMVREYLVTKYEYKAGGLNRRANAVVCAKCQAELLAKIDDLSLDEQDIVKRARNSHLNNKAKNSTLAEYSLATQFEALVGYWYLSGKNDRLQSVFDKYVVEKL